MQVSITVKVNIDRLKWANEFGIEPTAKVVRADVKQYVDVLVQEYPVIRDLAPQGV